MKKNILMRKFREVLREIEQGCFGRQGFSLETCIEGRGVPRRHLMTVLRRAMRRYAPA